MELLSYYLPTNSPLTPAINYGLKPCCQTAVTPSQKL
jgi:hypothetical protein